MERKINITKAMVAKVLKENHSRHRQGQDDLREEITAALQQPAHTSSKSQEEQKAVFAQLKTSKNPLTLLILIALGLNLITISLLIFLIVHLS